MDRPTAVPRSQSNELAVMERVGSTAIVTITQAELAGPETAFTLRGLLLAIRDEGARHLVLDLQNVASMDSACVGVLAEVLTQMQSDEQRGGRMALASAAGNVEYLFRITRLDRVFPICKDVMAALAVVEAVNEPGS